MRGFQVRDARVAGRSSEEFDVLYERANERFAKAVAFGGSYIIWGVLGSIVAGVVLLGS